MTKKSLWLCCLLILISISLIGQNNSNDKKIDSLNTIIERCTNCSRDLYERAKLYIAENKKIEAMSDLNSAIDFHIEYFLEDLFDKITLTRYYNERAFLKSELKDYRGAIQDYDRAIAMHKGTAGLWVEVFFGKGFCKAKIGDLEEALTSYEKVFVHNPDDEVTHYNLGLIKLELGKKDEGCLNLSKAGELGYSEAYKVISKNCN